MQYFRSEDSQLPVDLTLIKEHALVEFPREACGLIVVKKGKAKYYPCTNIAEGEDSFVIEPREFTKHSLSGDIVYVVHSHPTGQEPSEHDVAICNSLKIPYLIYYVEHNTFSLTYPEQYNSLVGRDYEFGIRDCFEAARDWYMLEGIITPPRAAHWKDDWWELGEDYIGKELTSWPFKRVQNIQYGDLLTFKVQSSVANHLAVYIDNDLIYHHAFGRLSCRENLYPLWAPHLDGIYRYEGSDIRGISSRKIW
jgi:proteasome lid subunit RPN8/RPN11